ncbi:hypothetical protein [Bradyrhizobium sp. CSA207]|nr:hypothetical protein [Bradyrhizobium sp. CSA207]
MNDKAFRDQLRSTMDCRNTGQPVAAALFESAWAHPTMITEWAAA